MRIISFNVNRLNSFNSYIIKNHNTNLNDYFLNDLNVDILCIQETRGSKQKLEEFTILKDYKMFINHNKKRNGYAGVCFFIKKDMYCRKIFYEIDELKELCDEGRVIAADFGNFKVFNFYLPFYDENLGVDEIKFEKVKKYYKMVSKYFQKENDYIICGDFNACYLLKDHYQYQREKIRILKDTCKIKEIENNLNDKNQLNSEQRAKGKSYNDKFVNEYHIEQGTNGKFNNDKLVNELYCEQNAKNYIIDSNLPNIFNCEENKNVNNHKNNFIEKHKKIENKNSNFFPKTSYQNANCINSEVDNGTKKFKTANNEPDSLFCGIKMQFKISQNVNITKKRLDENHLISFDENQEKIEKPFKSSTELPYFFKDEKSLIKYFFEKYQRNWLKEFVDRKNYIDTFYYLNPDIIKYSCWNTRFDLRPSNLGTRIDYIFVSKNLIELLSEAEILNEIHGSDHCPVQIVIDLPIFEGANNILKKDKNLFSFLNKK